MIETVDRIHSPLYSADERAVANPHGSQASRLWAPGQDLSPELVLVDPVLAARARSSLPEPGDTLSYLRAHPLRPSVVSHALNEGAFDTRARTSVPLPRPSLKRSLAAGAALGVVVVGLLLSDIRVELGQPSEAADPGGTSTRPSTSGGSPLDGVPTTTNGGRPSEPKATPTKARPSRPLRAAAGPRRFAWAPADGASGYRFELFRGASRVFSAEAPGPELTLPASWSDAGTRRTLEPGEYRWYVWPVVAGRRASEAIVQAKLSVPSR